MTVAYGNETDGSRHTVKASIDISISLCLEAAVRQIEVERAGCTSGIQSRDCYEHEDETDGRVPPRAEATMKLYHLVFAVQSSLAPVQQARRERSPTPRDGAKRATSGSKHRSEEEVVIRDD